jgi:hypothetical protein
MYRSAMSQMPDYLLPRPPMPTDPATLQAFDTLYDDAVARGAGSLINYDLAAPRWQFICHIADTRPVALHGSGNPSITRFEPRQPDDATEFGNQNAVYAASDGLWPTYFAILDRLNVPMSTINCAVRVMPDDGAQSDPYYFFSITQAALEKRPYRRGVIYFLPRATFRQQPPFMVGGQRVNIAQWASLEAVVPLARIEVGPEDFPLLEQMRGHDDESTFARARANPAGFPWLED